MKKLLLIVNPCAGLRKAVRQLADIVAIFNRSDYDVSVYITESRGDATRLVQQRAGAVDLVVCCGGDGTFNETVTGLLESGVHIPIGYIPSGSTNDFANSLRLSGDCREAARQIVDGLPRSYDIGKFDRRYFSYVASFGIFTRASYTTPQNIKNILGHMAYLLEGIQELTQLRKEHVMLELDDAVVEDDFLFGAICNSTSVGGILTLDPKQVDLQDGKFEVLLIRAPRDLTELKDCIQALQKQRYDCSVITFRSVTNIKVWASSHMPWSLDGELEDGHSFVQIENLHRAIRLIR